MSESPRVLIVEDCRDTAESVALLLKVWGITSAIAYDGRAALVEANKFLPDIVLLDIGLTGMDGLEVAQMLRRSSRFARTMIVVMSGYAASEDHERSLGAGCQLHIDKPVNPELLRALLLDGLREFRRHDAAAACTTCE